jgi:uncharacterized secreted protein with C-terminal beta-propeller domain
MSSVSRPFPLSSGKRRAAKRKAPLRLRIEPLEDRFLLAGGVAPSVIVAGAPVSVVGSSSSSGQETIAAPALFASEADLQQYLIDQAVKQWSYYLGKEFPNYYGWPYRFGIVSPLAGNALFTASAGIDIKTSAQSDPLPATDTGFSTTNVQVAGVDEADQVKTDSQYIYLFAGQKFEIVRAWPASDLAVVSHSWIEGTPLGLYLFGDRGTVISNVYDYNEGSEVKITSFDVSDPANPKVVQETYMDGWYVTSRAIDNKLYVVVQSSFKIPAPLFQVVNDERIYETEASYRARLAAMNVEDMLPEVYVRSQHPLGPLEEGGSLVDPSNIYQPISTDSNEILTVAAFDVKGSDSTPIDRVSVISPQATTVYASEDNIYVISAPWCSNVNTVVSTIEKISIGGDKLSVTAAGQVPGMILNQYSVDESGGYLRIATNLGHGATSMANLYILADEEGTLTIVGRLENLIPTERITAARFSGSHGFLFTAFFVDPLLTLDLSDPTNPRVSGQLSLPGFSEYFQFIDASHLLAVGRDDSHRLEVSLFDVSDFTAPVLVDQYLLGTNASLGWSEAEYDPHAFAYYGEFHTLAIPFSGSTPDGSFANQLVVLQVDDATGFHLVGSAIQPNTIFRSLRIENLLYSFDYNAIQVQSIDNPGVPIAGVSLIVPDAPRNATAARITANPGREFTGSVATLTGMDPTNLWASINWGDGTSSSGTITANGDGTFSVVGTHTYLQEKQYSITITLTNPDGTLSVQGAAAVARAPDQTPVAPDATGSTFTVNSNESFIDTGVTFTTSDPDKIQAMVDWGDGYFVQGKIVPNGQGAYTVQQATPDYYPINFGLRAVIAIPDFIAYRYLPTGPHDITVILYDGNGLPTVVHSTAIVNAVDTIGGGGNGGGCGTGDDDKNPPPPPSPPPPPAATKVEAPAPAAVSKSSVNFLPPPIQAATVVSASTHASPAFVNNSTVTADSPATLSASTFTSALGTSEVGPGGMGDLQPGDQELSEPGLNEGDGLKKTPPVDFEVALPEWPALPSKVESSAADQTAPSANVTLQSMSPTKEESEIATPSSASRMEIWSSPQDVLMSVFPEQAIEQGHQEMLGALLTLSLPFLGGPNAMPEKREKRRRKTI